MSAKQLKKLRELREAEAAATVCTEASGASDNDDENSSDEEIQRPANAGFAALLDSSEEEDPDDREDATDRARVCQGAAETGSAESARGSASAGRRRRRKAAASASTAVPSDGAANAAAAGEEDDDEDAFLSDLAAATGVQGGDTVDCEHEQLDEGETFSRSCLAMRRADFSAENERRRATGGRIGIGDDGIGGRGRGRGSGASRRLAVQARSGGQGRTAHHRRLFLVSPTAEESWWPRPDDCLVTAQVQLEKDAEATAFDIEDTPASQRCLQKLREVLRAYDPQLLQDYLHHGKNPFCVDGLLVLAEHLRTNHSHEQSFQLVRRAVYAIECGFGPAFSPFQASGGAGPSSMRPSVALRLSDSLEWPGWTWLRALWMYMHGLAASGMHRTALEVCKFILAATLPRDPCHVLLVFDFLCLRARRYDELARFSAHLVLQYGLSAQQDGDCDDGGDAYSTLDLILPNFAYSVALAGLLKADMPTELSTALNEVSVADVLSPLNATASDSLAESDPGSGPTPAATAALAQLMRALLIFPLALRPLLDEAGVKLGGSAPVGSISRATWTELLGRQPFTDAASHRHSRYAVAHSRAVAAYARRCGALWRADLPIRCLHSCAARLASLYESSVFAAELTDARQTWASRPLALMPRLEQDLLEFYPDEGAAEAPPPTPPALERAVQARLHPPRDPADEELYGEGRVPGGFLGGARLAANAGVLPPPTISLHSPPLLIFFQSLLPWAEIDRSGVAVEPLCWSDVAKAFTGPIQTLIQELWQHLRPAAPAAQEARQGQRRRPRGQPR